MRNIINVFLSIFIFILNINPTLAFDFAPEVGDTAPGFHLSGTNKSIKSKKEWDLNDFNNNWLILYFYPKDFTAGCTIEAKGFSEKKSEFDKLNAKVVGISADNDKSHESFCDEKSINYTLLSDPEGFISKKYGSWIPPYSDRNTFLISPQGIIKHRWISVTPFNHANEVLNILKKSL